MEDFRKLNLEVVVMFDKKKLPLNKIEVLVGNFNLKNAIIKPFDALMIDFLSRFSNELDKSKFTKNYKDIKTSSQISEADFI